MLVPPPKPHAPPQTAQPLHWAPFALGFRPFFLLAGLWAAVAVPLWLAVLYGFIPPPRGNPMAWHAGEMVFGYAAAVIIGFLLTAVRNWTGRETLKGAPLAALAACWLAGRIGPWIGGGAGDALQLLGVVPMVALPVAIGIPIFAAGNRRNYAIVAVVVAMAAAHVALWFWRDDSSRLFGAIEIGLAATAVLIAWIGGRVIPFFTARGIGGSPPTAERWPLALWATVAWGAAKWWSNDGAVAATGIVAAALHARRLWRWHDRRIWAAPLVWVLHVAYGWLALAPLLDAAAAFDLVAATAGRHALTAGTIGSITLGMMARVSLGHTGRLLRAPKATAAAFGMITGAAVLRVFAAWAPPNMVPFALMLSGFLWAGAFLAFVIDYTPILLRSRLDGQPG